MERFDMKLGDMTAIEAEWRKAPKQQPMRRETPLEMIARVGGSHGASAPEQAADEVRRKRIAEDHPVARLCVSFTERECIALEKILRNTTK